MARGWHRPWHHQGAREATAFGPVRQSTFTRTVARDGLPKNGDWQHRPCTEARLQTGGWQARERFAQCRSEVSAQPPMLQSNIFYR